MTLWKIDGKKAKELEKTNFISESIEESEIEDWIEANPDILGEPLMIIGRQVVIADLGDTLDLLALDRFGNIVIIELKRADLKAPVDIQGIRYASYASRWVDRELEEIYAGYIQDSDSEEEGSLETAFLEFSDEAGSLEEVHFNDDQRIILVGQHIRDRLGSVALWLREHKVDMKVVEIHPFRDGDTIYLEPLVIIPAPTTEQWEVGSSVRGTDKPWIIDGHKWWEKKATEKQWMRLKHILGPIEDGLASKISYTQRHYIAVHRGKRTWLRVQPTPHRIRIDVRCREDDFNVSEVAKKLGLHEFDDSAELGEKLALPSSVGTYSRRTYYVLRFRIKEDYDITNPSLAEFWKQAAEIWEG